MGDDRSLCVGSNATDSSGRWAGQRSDGSLYGTLQEADAAPTSQTLAAVADRERALADLMARWAALRGADLAALNARLRAANAPEIH